VAVLQIVQVGDPVLRERARELRPEEIGAPDVRRLCDDLVETMRAACGAGIAAPQVGELLRVFAVEVRDNERYPYKPRLDLRILLNPVVRPLTDEMFMSYEGCLSVPDLRGLLPRHAEVEVSYLDPEGDSQVERFGGLSAGTMQHELDHLDGVLFLDRVPDPATLCTWDMFRRHHQEGWLETIRPLLERFPAEETR
jgi:peptide deformylase